jgi:hypothetical protein
MYLYSAAATTFIHGMPHTYPLLSYLGASAVALLVGIYFLRGAPRLIRVAYPLEKSTELQRSTTSEHARGET